MTLLTDTQASIHHHHHHHHHLYGSSSTDIKVDLRGQKEHSNSSPVETVTSKSGESVTLSVSLDTSSINEVAPKVSPSSSSSSISSYEHSLASISMDGESERQRVILTNGNDENSINGEEKAVEEEENHEVSSEQAQPNCHHQPLKSISSNLHKSANTESEPEPEQSSTKSSPCAITSTEETPNSNTKCSPVVQQDACDYIPAPISSYTSTAIPATRDSQLTETAINFSHCFPAPIYQPAIYTAVPSGEPHHPMNTMMIHPYDHTQAAHHLFTLVEHVQQQATPIYYYYKYPAYQPSPLRMTSFYTPAVTHYGYQLSIPSPTSIRSQYFSPQHPVYQPYVSHPLAARYSPPTFREQQLLYNQPVTMIAEPPQQFVGNPQLLDSYQHQFCHYSNYYLPYKTVSLPHSQVGSESSGLTNVKPVDYDPVALLPIDAQPTCTRQAYGMDKVWHDEFGQIFSQLVPGIYWNLSEVETNPSIRESASIIAYKGRYIVVAPSSLSESSPVEENEDFFLEKKQNLNEDKQNDELWDDADKEEDEEEDDDDDDDESHSLTGSSSSSSSDSIGISDGESKNKDTTSPPQSSESQSKEEPPNDTSLAELESDCDSGTQIDSTSGSISTATNDTSLNSTQQGISPSTSDRKFPTRFRMFIDSAKVRFCCDLCGHGWTSMKGRVVFWYELFELVDESESHLYQEEDDDGPTSNNLIGYCAYKLFGQQCDICKIENRFERPMWYPEEVTKVLHNLYNKIGQVYFGFKMPTIDKQRRAGKPKTSHNSSLCQACHDGVCTDRK